jgi:hypothetical protein
MPHPWIVTLPDHHRDRRLATLATCIRDGFQFQAVEGLYKRCQINYLDESETLLDPRKAFET